MNVRPLVVFAVLLPASPLLRAQAPQANPRDARIAEVVRFGGTDAAPLTLDRYAPAGPGPHPAVIIVHGGGFVGGTSRNGSEAYAADFLAPAGYAIFSVNYRLAPGATFADMIADVQRSIRFVRYSAARFDVDPEKIALLGGSAGGYLSNMVGLATPSTDLAAADPVDRVSDKLEAVVTLYGISRIATMPDDFAGKYHLIGPDKPTPEQLLEASPISHVSPQAPPFLFVHGDHDQSVPLAQSIELMDALAQAGVRTQLIVIPNGPHGTWLWPTLPGEPEWERETAEWLNRTLGHNGPIGAGIEARRPGAAH